MHKSFYLDTILSRFTKTCSLSPELLLLEVLERLRVMSCRNHIIAIRRLLWVFLPAVLFSCNNVKGSGEKSVSVFSSDSEKNAAIAPAQEGELINSFERLSSQPYFYSSDWDSKPNYIVFLKEKEGKIIGMEIRQYEDISYYEWLTFQEAESSAAELEKRTPSRTVRLYPKDDRILVDEDGKAVAEITDANRWWSFRIVSSSGEETWFTGQYGLML